MSFASILLSYFLIAGGTFFAALLAGRMGIRSEYVGYVVLALGGFLGGIVAARASKGSTIIEPAIGAVLLIASFIGLGLAKSGEGAGALLLPGTMKGIALTALAMGGGGVGGAFVTEKIFGDDNAGYGAWILFVAIAGFGAGVIGMIFGGVIGKGEAGPIFGFLAISCLIVGGATGASASTRPHGASFLGGLLGVGGFFGLAVYLLVSLVGSKGMGRQASEGVPSEVYASIAIIAVGAGIVTLIGSLIGWATVGKKNA
jgi:hypothetical protein